MENFTKITVLVTIYELVLKNKSQIFQDNQSRIRFGSENTFNNGISTPKIDAIDFLTRLGIK